MPCGPALSAYNLLRMAGLAALLGNLCVASAQAPPAPARPLPAFAAAAPPGNAASAAAKPPLNPEIVPLDFTVRTKSGKPVLNLQPSDLRLTDNGAAVELKQLRLVKGTDGQDRLVTLIFDSLDVAPAQDARRLAAKLLAQFPPTGYAYAVMQIAGSSPPPATILPPGPDVQQVSSPGGSSLPSQSGSFVATPGLRLLQSYTASRDLLRKAIDQATSGNAAQQDAGNTPAEEQLTAFARRDPGAAHAEDLDRSESLLSALDESRHPSDDGAGYSSLSALLALVRSQRPIVGRKIILYFSQGIPVDDDSLNIVGSIIAEANRSEVSIITVNLEPAVTLDVEQPKSDAGNVLLLASGERHGRRRSSRFAQQQMFGFNPADPFTTSGIVDLMHLGFSPGPTPGSGAAGAPDPQPLDPLRLLAAATNGVPFADAHIKKPLRQLREELTDYYEATYTPKLTSYDGEFHPLIIRAPRRHLLVRSRPGYFALPPDSSSGLRLYEVPLLAILSSPRLPAEIAYHAQVIHLGEFSGKNTSELVVEVPLSRLQVRADADTNLSSAHIAIVMQVRNAKGEVLARFSEDLLRRKHVDVAHFSDAQYSGDDDNPAADRDAIVMEHPFAADPGDYTLETAVLDEVGNKAGAQRMTFTVAPPQPQRLLSDLALVRRIDPLGRDAQKFEPMRCKDGRIVPDLTGVLPENTEHVSFFVLIHSTGETQPRLTLHILRDGRYVTEIPLKLALPVARASGKPPSENDVLPWLGTVQASAFPPGHYEVQATLSHNGQTASASTSFVVQGKGTAANVAFTAVSGQADPDRDLPAERRLTESAALGSSSFTITSPANPLPPPTPAELQALVESARERALAWTDSLPNFLCIETTWHSVYSRSSASWQPQDTVVQLMRYVDHAEDRTLVELNGRRYRLPSQVDFAHSTGEFGGALLTIFDPAAHAQFTWKETDLLEGQPVDVLAYRVARATSEFELSNEVHDAMVALHGLV